MGRISTFQPNYYITLSILAFNYSKQILYFMKIVKLILNAFSLFLLSCFLSFSALGGTVISKAVAGGWSNTTTWLGGIVPGITDSVVVVSGASISTGTNQSCGAVNILGTLTLTGGNYLTVAGDGITSFGSVSGNGTLGYSSIGNRNISLTGDWTFNGTSSNTGENVTFNGTSTQRLQGIITTGTGGTGMITINNSGGQVIMGSAMAFSNQGITITSGTFNPNGFLMTVNKFILGAGTVIVDASIWAGNYSVTTLNSPSSGNTIQYTNANPTINSAITYQNLNFSGSGSTGADGNLIIQGNLSNTGGGTLNFGTNNVTLSGTVASNTIAGFTTSGGVSFTKTSGTSTLSGNLSSGALTMNGNGGSINLGAGLIHSITSLEMTKGTLNGGASELDVSGAWTGTGATFVAGTGTVGYISPIAQSIPVAPVYYNLLVSGAGTKTIASSPLTLGGSLILSSGSSLTTATTTTINIGGSWTNNGGMFINTNTSVILNGTTTQTISGSQGTTFNNLTISTNGANTILGVASSVANQFKFTSGSLDASNYSLTLNAGAPAISGASATSYIITGNGTTTTGILNINSLAGSTGTIFPIGTASYYMPATLNPGATTGENFSAFVFEGTTTNGASNGPAFGSIAMTQMVNAVWDIERTAGSGTVSLTLDWSASGLNLEGSAFQGFGLNVGISHYTGGSWQSAIGIGSSVTETATASFSSFSPFGVGSSGVVLPITFIDFIAELKNDLVGLSWSCATSTNGGNFTIERSVDGANWKSIGTIPENGGASMNQYYFTDGNPKDGINYYRVQLTDVSGSQTYSTIEDIEVTSLEKISVFPNPTSKNLNIFIPKGKPNGRVLLFNLYGQLMQTANIKGGASVTVVLPIFNYIPGTYILEIVGDDGTKQIHKVAIIR
jgi:hypothetical protein